MTVQSGDEGHIYQILSLNCSAKMTEYLHTLGFYQGGTLTIITKTRTNFILNVKDSRYAMDSTLAGQIVIQKKGGITP